MDSSHDSIERVLKLRFGGHILHADSDSSHDSIERVLKLCLEIATRLDS